MKSSGINRLGQEQVAGQHGESQFRMLEVENDSVFVFGRDSARGALLTIFKKKNQLYGLKEW